MPNVFVIFFFFFYVFFLLLSVISQSSAAATAPKRAVYILDTTNAAYLSCSMPGLRRYAAAYRWPLHEMTAGALRRRRASRLQTLKRLQMPREVIDSNFTAGLEDDGHFAKLQVFADALERGYDEILYVDVDVMLNEKRDIPNIFEAADLPADKPSIALYGQRSPKPAVVEAIFRINTRLFDTYLETASLPYWNTGVIVINRAAMMRLKALVEIFFASWVRRRYSVDELPFFDQGFTNAVLWDPRFNFFVRALSFAWNTSHSKYFYHHGDQFWLQEDEYRNKEFVPFIFHFMGCAGRNQTASAGEKCKYERMREFARSHLNLTC